MPRNTLTADQIVQAAIAHLDEEGLDGLTMRALGKRLDVAATAVYWHIKTKDELVRLAADAAWAEVELPDPARVGWRAAAVRTATSSHAMFTRHPWMGQAFGGYLLYGPGKSRHDDHLLAVYEAAGFAPADADRAAAAVFTYVLGNALAPAAMVALNRRLAIGGEDAARAFAEAQENSVAIARTFPRLRERIDSPAASYAGTPEDSFELGLTGMLDGFQARLAAGAER
ncbi:TetR/AcrR family transcriptional regulator C-terminal domain-containing protein [Catenulispora sp. NL8]|uniref:TetR/AcrR family transcriptional regulator C-terminal domain-containing protein n=1 Tax=Catenulispora pinistramenti TaxID=2705254 RepID=A0ABS5KTG6_9ACTN|nr:TetR/AcrR family transcriptional regulator C-terminal domain-containing protein [Catenulispora pinistramenti]MBS2549347.1 TetR/AcrR family transcriptional regulator C-terminal domain-containing protein [Catenulispora pinistramenti]